MIDRLFVYGTLRRGEVRWPFLEPLVVDEGVPDTAAGQLHDTGLGYPAAVFDGSATIHGATFRLSPDTLAQALELLDEVEGAVVGLYHRIEVTTGAGHRAWAYASGESLDLTPIPSGDWSAR